MFSDYMDLDYVNSYSYPQVDLDPISSSGRSSDNGYASQFDPISSSERSSDNGYASQFDPISSSERSSDNGYASQFENSMISYAIFNNDQPELQATTWMIQAPNITTFEQPTTESNIEIFNDEVPLSVDSINNDSKTSDFSEMKDSLSPKRRGRRRKDWEGIAKELSRSNLSSENHRKLRNNISSAHYRSRKTTAAVEDQEKCDKYRRTNQKYVKHSSSLEEISRKLRKMYETCQLELEIVSHLMQN
jgi:hypothetical protein